MWDEEIGSPSDSGASVSGRDESSRGLGVDPAMLMGSPTRIEVADGGGGGGGKRTW